MPASSTNGIQQRTLDLLRRVLNRRVRWTLAGLALVGSLIVLASDKYIEHRAEGRVFATFDDLPYRPVGVVLGTSPYADYGKRNSYYSRRIEAAAELYHRGKVSHLIVSGSNPDRYYNEPHVMRADLVALGVPDDKITSDYAGRRTLDSVVRAHKVFGQEAFTVITQRFHLLRALYIGRHKGLDVVGYPAMDPDSWYHIKARLREYGARSKALLDLWVLDTQPKFLGERVAISFDSDELQYEPCAAD